MLVEGNTCIGNDNGSGSGSGVRGEEEGNLLRKVYI